MMGYVIYNADGSDLNKRHSAEKMGKKDFARQRSAVRSVVFRLLVGHKKSNPQRNKTA